MTCARANILHVVAILRGPLPVVSGTSLSRTTKSLTSLLADAIIAEGTQSDKGPSGFGSTELFENTSVAPMSVHTCSGCHAPYLMKCLISRSYFSRITLKTVKSTKFIAREKSALRYYRAKMIA